MTPRGASIVQVDFEGLQWNTCAMVLELKSTRSEFELADESGYKFKVVAEQVIEGDRKGAWGASVTFSTWGFKNEEGAVLHLIGAAEHFIRMLKEARRDGDV
jgi:hypothetical protein